MLRTLAYPNYTTYFKKLRIQLYAYVLQVENKDTIKLQNNYTQGHFTKTDLCSNLLSSLHFHLVDCCMWPCVLIVAECISDRRINVQQVRHYS